LLLIFFFWKIGKYFIFLYGKPFFVSSFLRMAGLIWFQHRKIPGGSLLPGTPDDYADWGMYERIIPYDSLFFFQPIQLIYRKTLFISSAFCTRAFSPPYRFFLYLLTRYMSAFTSVFFFQHLISDAFSSYLYIILYIDFSQYG